MFSTYSDVSQRLRPEKCRERWDTVLKSPLLPSLSNAFDVDPALKLLDSHYRKFGLFLRALYPANIHNLSDWGVSQIIIQYKTHNFCGIY